MVNTLHKSLNFSFKIPVGKAFKLLEVTSSNNSSKHFKNYKKFKAMTQIKQAKTKNLSEVGESIGLAEGKKLVDAFKQANPDATLGYYIGRNILDQIMAQPGCVGINFRKCLTETNQEHLVYTAVDAEGKDILEYSVVTKTGDVVKEKGIVADRTIWF